MAEFWIKYRKWKDLSIIFKICCHRGKIRSGWYYFFLSFLPFGLKRAVIEFEIWNWAQFCRSRIILFICECYLRCLRAPAYIFHTGWISWSYKGAWGSNNTSYAMTYTWKFHRIEYCRCHNVWRSHSHHCPKPIQQGPGKSEEHERAGQAGILTISSFEILWWKYFHCFDKFILVRLF